MQENTFRVLVMGYRQALCRALEQMHIPYALWSDKPVKSKSNVLHCHLAKFPRDDDRIFDEVAAFNAFGPFTHVIAGSEAAVYAAAVVRRLLQARSSLKSVALRCHDKLQMKTYLSQRGIPMTPFIAGDEIDDPAALLRKFGTPLVIKARQESGGRGIRLVHSAQDVVRYAGRNKIIEQYIDAPEASVECFINNGEILFQSCTQYYLKKHINLVPGGLPVAQHEALLALNRQVLAALKIKWGITHLEVYLGRDGLLFGEIALRPPGGYIMELISKAYGFSSWQALVHMELDLPFDFPAAASCYSAALIIHPGAGRVATIQNWDKVIARPAVYKARSKIEPGSLVAERAGVGEDAGYFLLSANSQAQLLRELDFIDNSFSITMDSNANI